MPLFLSQDFSFAAARSASTAFFDGWFRPLITLPACEDSQEKIGRLERLPKWLNLVPMILQWLYLSLRYRSLTLPSVANPQLTAGGMVGEGKLEYITSLGSKGLRTFAGTCALLRDENFSITQALDTIRRAGISFPFIVKPNIGWCGYGVRLVRNENDLKAYVEAFPLAEVFLAQQFVDWQGEASLFYVRYPGEKQGRVTAITLRGLPEVTGDGTSKIEELVMGMPRLKRLYTNPHHEALWPKDHVPAKGEKIRLAIIGSTRVGGLYRDGNALLSDELSAAIDDIAREMPDFYVGRFDVRFSDMEELKQGEGFRIVEINGAGSEAIHAWDPSFSLTKAYRIVFDKQRLLFRIGAINRSKGHKPIGFGVLLRLHVNQQRLISRYPPSQ